jgi:hypothetical protein
MTPNAIAENFKTTRQAVSKTPPHFNRMRIGKTGTTRQGDLLLT